MEFSHTPERKREKIVIEVHTGLHKTKYMETTWNQNRHHVSPIWSSSSSSPWQDTAKKNCYLSAPSCERIMCLLDANKALPVIANIHVKTAAHTSHLQNASLLQQSVARALLPFSPHFSRMNLKERVGYGLENRATVVWFSVRTRDIYSLNCSYRI